MEEKSATKETRQEAKKNRNEIDVVEKAPKKKHQSIGKEKVAVVSGFGERVCPSGLQAA